MAASAADGSSQARGQIGAAAVTYATATTTLDPSHICDIRRSLWQHWTLNPLSEARDRTRIFMDTSQVLNLLSHSGNSSTSWSSTFLLLVLQPHERRPEHPNVQMSTVPQTG